MNTTSIEPVAFDTKGAAEYTGVPKKSLEWRRYKKLPPNYVLLPGSSSIRYLKADLDAFLAQGQILAAEGPTKEQKVFRKKGGPGRPRHADRAKVRNRTGATARR